MIQWPAKCAQCGREIEDWADTGLFRKGWLHKACWSERWRDAQAHGAEIMPLRSPVDRGRLLEWPMLAFVLMFHFGLGAAIAGWLMLTQGHNFNVPGWAFFTSDPDTFAAVLLIAGIVAPVVGITGAALNILGRRRIEIIRQELELQGGWKPGR